LSTSLCVFFRHLLACWLDATNVTMLNGFQLHFILINKSKYWQRNQTKYFRQYFYTILKMNLHAFLCQKIITFTRQSRCCLHHRQTDHGNIHVLKTITCLCTVHNYSIYVMHRFVGCFCPLCLTLFINYYCQFKSIG